MNDKTEGLLDEVISKHNFVVRVNTDPDDSLCVMIDFAGKKRAYYRVVTDDEGEVYGVAYWSDLMGDEAGEEFLPLNKTVIRLYILCDIYRQCRQLDLSYEIVRFYDSDGSKIEFMDLLSLNLDETEVDIEQTLEICLSSVIEQSHCFEQLGEALEKDSLWHHFAILKATLI